MLPSRTAELVGAINRATNRSSKRDHLETCSQDQHAHQYGKQALSIQASKFVGVTCDGETQREDENHPTTKIGVEPGKIAVSASHAEQQRTTVVGLGG